MTGEITLSGLVFPVGGIKGKVLAARRSGMKRVVLPKKNEPDLKDIPEEALRDLEVVLVERIEELLPQTLTPVDEPGSQRPLPEPEPVTTGTEVRVEGGEARA
jgi:ATP-dependent Lon protease